MVKMYPFDIKVKVAEIYRSKSNNLTCRPNITEVAMAAGISRYYVTVVKKELLPTTLLKETKKKI